jgi:hypothetical protein
MRGDNRSYSLDPHASVRTERTVQVETDPAVNPGALVSASARVGESVNYAYLRRGTASGDSMKLDVTRIPGFVLITATQNEAEPVSVSLGAPQAAQLFLFGRGGIRSTVNILVSEDGSHIHVFGERSSFPAMEINASAGGQTFSIFRGKASGVPAGLGIFGTQPINRECSERATGTYACN